MLAYFNIFSEWIFCGEEPGFDRMSDDANRRADLLLFCIEDVSFQQIKIEDRKVCRLDPNKFCRTTQTISDHISIQDNLGTNFRNARYNFHDAVDIADGKPG